MHSLRTKSALLTVCAIIIAIAVVTVLSVLFIINTEQHKSDQLLYLMCETGQKNLDYYFNDVEKSMDKVLLFAEDDLDSLEDEKFQKHVDRMDEFFGNVANKTSGVLTYYYRIDPSVSDTVKGFWYTNLDGNDFVEHEVTDITKYDTEDTSQLVWFTVPKATRKPIWLPPYITDNLDVRVISYNIPIYYKDQFVGVAGIEIDYTTMAEQVDNIRLFNNGYAYINDDEGNLIFHPFIDVAKLDGDEIEKPAGITSKNTFFSYEYDGVEKEAVWLPLSNGMRLNVAVPLREINGDWHKLIVEVLGASVLVLLLLGLLTIWFTGYITRPLQQLTVAAEQLDKGNYDVDLTYDQDDEIGKLTRTFTRLVGHVKDQISDLNKKVYVDALTSVQNKGAFTAYLDGLQEQVDDPVERTEYAIGIFDCDNLKMINDQYGHDKGDVYLKTACRLICRMFHHSPVFRIGGDEFAVVLKNEDYQNRAALLKQFEEERQKICDSTENEWEKVYIGIGIAEYDAAVDKTVNDTVLRADKYMYADKSARKEAGKSSYSNGGGRK